MRLGLRHSMQIESCLDFVQTALQPLGVGAVDSREAIERRCRPQWAGSGVLNSGRAGIGRRSRLWRNGRLTSAQWLYIANRFMPLRTITPTTRCVARRFHFPTPAHLRQAQYGDAEVRAHRARCAARYLPSAMDR
jgi:hypothetical protein